MSEIRPFKAYGGDGKFIMLSYAHKDAEAVYKIAEGLYLRGYNIWYDQGVPNNAFLDAEIAKRIRACEAFIVFLSQNATDSLYVFGKELPIAQMLGKRIIYVKFDPEDNSDYSNVVPCGIISGSIEELIPAIITKLTPGCRDTQRRLAQPTTIDERFGVRYVLDSASDYDYALYNNELTITNYKGSETDIVIPAQINGYPVVGIGTATFYNPDSQLRSVKMPESVTTIYNSAFCGCEALTDVELSPGLEYLFEYAFEGCTALESITLPQGLKLIDYAAFGGCSSLREIILPDSVTEIDRYSFEDCPSLVRAVVPPQVVSIGDWAFGGRTLSEKEVAERSLKIVCVRDSKIHSAATFFGYHCELVSEDEMKQLTEICRVNSKKESSDEKDGGFLGNLVSQESDYAAVLFAEADLAYARNILSPLFFDGFNMLHCKDSETLGGAKVTLVLLSGAFDEISKLAELAANSNRPLLTVALVSSVVVPDYLLEHVVLRCSETSADGLTGNLRDFLSEHSCKSTTAENERFTTQFSHPVFDYESNDGSACITRYKGPGGKLEIPAELFCEEVLGISSEAVAGRADITEIVLPGSIKSLKERSFAGCTALKTVKFAEGLAEIGAGCFAGCSSIEALELPQSLESISSEAFRNCRSITNVDIPAKVRQIGEGAFGGCVKLENATLPEGLAAVPERLFEGCTALSELYIPASAADISESAFNGCKNLTLTAPRHCAAMKFARKQHMAFKPAK